MWPRNSRVTDIQFSLTNNTYTYKVAYDTVDLNVLTENLISLDVESVISHNIVDLLQNPKIYIKDHNNMLQPRSTSRNCL